MLKRIFIYIRRLYYNINKKMFVPQARWLLSWVRKLSSGERWTGNRFWFLSKVGGVGDGERIEPQFFLFYSLNLGSIQFCFPRLIFVSGLVLKVIVFLGI